jgi:RimJ/RimL family protein N-acetyltransferase
MIHDQRPVGRCGIIVSDDEAEIHLILAKDYWKQKLGTEVASALTELAAEKFPGKTLLAKVHQGNNASLAILQGLGMVPLGRISSSGYDNDFVRFERPRLAASLNSDR